MLKSTYFSAKNFLFAFLLIGIVGSIFLTVANAQFTFGNLSSTPNLNQVGGDSASSSGVSSLGNILGAATGLASALTGGAVGGGTSAIISTLCGIINSISEVISTLALFLFILGGTLYAFAHFLPAAGNLRGSMQGWGMGMLMGGIIALILYILAPFVIGQLVNISTGSTNSTGLLGAAQSLTGTSTSLTTPSCGLLSGTASSALNTVSSVLSGISSTPPIS